MKRIISKDVLPSYPNFNKPFTIQTDASHDQLGGVIAQDGKLIAIHSGKLNAAQTRCTAAERELLSIAEIPEEFRNILFGQEIVTHTDHKNLTCKEFTTERVLR